MCTVQHISYGPWNFNYIALNLIVSNLSYYPVGTGGSFAKAKRPVLEDDKLSLFYANSTKVSNPASSSSCVFMVWYLTKRRNSFTTCLSSFWADIRIYTIIHTYLCTYTWKFFPLPFWLLTFSDGPWIYTKFVDLCCQGSRAAFQSNRGGPVRCLLKQKVTSLPAKRSVS